MKSLVVYESRYGNTAEVARAIAAALEASGPVRVVEAAEPSAFDLLGVDLFVLGGPTEGHGVSHTLRDRVQALPDGALQGIAAATFDTRVNWPEFMMGSAAKGLAKALERLGAELVVPPESFLVRNCKPPELVPHELARTAEWATHLRATAEARMGAAAGVGAV